MQSADPYLRIVMFFDQDETAGAFLREDGDGGFPGALYRMAREIDRLRTTIGNDGRQFMQSLVDDASGEKLKRKAAEREIERLRGALSCIAHTFTEDSHGGTKALPATDYQAMARAAITTIGAGGGE